MKISNELALLISSLLLLTAVLLFALIALIYCIQNFGPGGETFELRSEEENQEEEQ